MSHAGMPAGDGLSIGQLAEATGVAAGTLRMWESRHGFPAPARGAGRHRRYSADDVERVGLVRADRDRGLSLAAAIERARAWSPAAPGSIFAAVRALQPSPQALRLPLWAMLAVSRAIEDECLARAGRPLLAGSFQTERAFRRAEHRWQELSRSAALSFVLADFVRPRTPRGGPLEVRTGAGMPVRREWAVIALDPHYTACLAAWELPRQAGERWFEAIWTTAAGVVTDAMRTAIGLAGPRVAERGAEALSTNAPPAADATPALANRMIGYLVERSA
jgi:MerR family transcriptional regulator, light-induced transcriptional regulator